MKEKLIALNSINDIKEFVNQAILVDGDILCIRGHYVVDASSLLGILSINVSDGFTVRYPDDAEQFDSYIDKFVINL